MKALPLAFSAGFLLCVLTPNCLAQKRQVAITIDDLPVASVGDDASPATAARAEKITLSLLQTLKRHHTPVIVFVNEVKLNVTGARDERASLLAAWLAQGEELGNHGYAHHSISKMTFDDQKFEVIRGEVITSKLMTQRGLGKEHFFRYPFNDTGDTREKKEAFLGFLHEHGYEPAPVTLSADDWLYADLYDRAKTSGDTAMVEKLTAAYLQETKEAVTYADAESDRMFGRQIPQALLIHASGMNADLLDRVLEVFEKDDYKFVTLREAVADKAYTTPDEFYESRGVAWFDRWRVALKTAPLDQPQPKAPAWVWEAYTKMTQSK